MEDLEHTDHNHEEWLPLDDPNPEGDIYGNEKKKKTTKEWIIQIGVVFLIVLLVLIFLI